VPLVVLMRSEIVGLPTPLQRLVGRIVASIGSLAGSLGGMRRGFCNCTEWDVVRNPVAALLFIRTEQFSFVVVIPAVVIPAHEHLTQLSFGHTWPLQLPKPST
jgi:hypothetical protein